MTLAPTTMEDEPPLFKPPPPRPAPPTRPALPPARPSAPPARPGPPPARPAEPPARPAPPPARPAPPPSLPVKEEVVSTEPETEPDRGGFSDIFGVTSPMASDLPISLSSGSLVGLATSNSTTTSKDEKSKLHKLISQGSKSLEYPEGFDPLSESEKAWTNGSGDDDDEDPELPPPVPTCDIPAKPSLPPRQTSNDTQSGGSTAPGTPTKLPPVPKRAPPPPLPSRPPSGPPPALPAGRPPGGPPPPIPKR